MKRETEREREKYRVLRLYNSHDSNLYPLEHLYNNELELFLQCTRFNIVLLVLVIPAFLRFVLNLGVVGCPKGEVVS